MEPVEAQIARISTDIEWIKKTFEERHEQQTALLLEIKESINRQGDRLRTLESWKNWMAGSIGVISFVVTYIAIGIRDKIFK